LSFWGAAALVRTRSKFTYVAIIYHRATCGKYQALMRVKPSMKNHGRDCQALRIKVARFKAVATAKMRIA
jgi:hypothetical protein